MLELIDEALEAFLRAEVPLSSTEIDMSFDPPDREWSARLVRPTVNAFLWDIRRSASRAQSGMRTVEHEGTMVHQPALPVIELRYVLTAWASDKGDERDLLSGLLRVILQQAAFPRRYLATELDQLEPPTLLVARAGEDHMDVFKALEGQIKPGINMTVSTEFDTGVRFPAGPPITSIESAVAMLGKTAPRRRRLAGEVVGAIAAGAIGVVVRSTTDATVVNEAGRFLLRAAPGDEITLDTSPPLVTTVPDAGGVRFEL
jgi:hypothetical protein